MALTVQPSSAEEWHGDGVVEFPPRLEPENFLVVRQPLSLDQSKSVAKALAHRA
mgnify:CR=1 FL=1